MSGSGKSTLAEGLVLFLKNKNHKALIVDGDAVRGKDREKLGFGYDDVMINNIRIANRCQELRCNYDAIVVPVISPYDVIRIKVRKILEPNFHLVYLKADIESLLRRDPKGLYAAADRGDITDLIGYSKCCPYEEPENAELMVETGNHISVNDSKNILFDYVNSFVFANL